MGKGYLIPENAQPTENRCLRVFVPDDPLYVAAFLGALTYFGQWTAWERDKEKRGQFAAHAWRDANDLTIDGLSLPCGDNPITDEEMSEILEQLESIQTQLAELNDMNITVTQTNGCCCDGSETVTTETITDGLIIDPEDDGKTPKYDVTPKPTPSDTRCRAANWLAVTVARMTRTMATIGSMTLSLQNVYSVMVGILTINSGVIWSMTAILALGYRLINLLLVDTYGYFDTVADKMESNMEEFVCSLYNWSSAENLGAMLNGAIMGYVDEVMVELGLEDTTADSMYTALVDVMGATFVNYFVDNIGSIVPADFVAQYRCVCGATGDYCPDVMNLVVLGTGSLPDGDLTGTTQGLAAQFNSGTGFYELVFEMTDNYCVTIENSGQLTIEEMHQVCIDGVMSPSDGSCIRRYAARSQAPFATAVTFESISTTCGDCNDPPETKTACKDYALEAPFSLGGGGPTVYDVDHVQMTSPVDYNDIPQWDGWVNEKVQDWLTYNNETPVAVWVFINLPINMRVTVQQWHDGGVSDDIHDEILQAGSGWYRLPTPVSWAFDGLSQRDLEIKFRNDFNVATSIRLDKICIEF